MYLEYGKTDEYALIWHLTKSRRWALIKDMYDKVKKYVQQNRMLDGCRNVVIALSGGADSVCLAHIMKRLSDEAGGFEITAVHVHHGIRGAEADRDAEFCKKLCSGLGIGLKEIRRDVPAYAREQKLGSEEAGRRLRYEALRGEALNLSCAKIAVAHHMNDQAETVVFNMCRGSGIRGMRGMLPENDRIIRPLLCCTREEIEEYLRERDWRFCTDSTNGEDSYARNRIRHKVLPFLEENINVRAVRNIAAMADRMARAEAYLEKQTDKGYEKAAAYTGDGILLKNLEAEEPYIAGRIIRRALGELASGLKDIGEIHVDAVATLINAKSGKRADVSRGIEARREPGGIFLRRNKDGERFAPIEISLPCGVIDCGSGGSFEFSVEDWNKEEKISNSIYTKCFDYDKIKFGLWLRTREDGDYLTIDALGHHKKLNQYYIDEKIPGYMRDGTLLLADGHSIMWVVGGRISEEYKISVRTKRVLWVRYGGLTDGES